MSKSKTPPGMRAVYALVPEGTWEKFAGVMRDTGRGIAEELAHAMERHAQQPPTVLAPPLTPVEVVKQEPEKRRGRKPKEQVAKE